eukprot:jgi/Ulvmu1/11073/UM007_0255.1
MALTKPTSLLIPLAVPLRCNRAAACMASLHPKALGVRPPPPASHALRSDRPSLEACRYGTSLRTAAMAAASTTPQLATPSPGPKTAKQARKAAAKGKGKGKGKVFKRSKTAPASQQVEPPVEEAGDAQDVVWVPDSSGGRRRVRLSRLRTLMLDSSYRPVAVINWQKAMVLEWMQKVDVLEYYSDVSVASASEVFPLPAVMRCRAYVQRPRRRSRMMVSKRNILLRDRHMCQYCGSRAELTIDHVVPVSKGGELTWSNCVTACRACNAKKGNKTLQQLGWTVRKPPTEPQAHELAPLRLIPKVAMEVEAAEAHAPHPWRDYVTPLLQSYAAARTTGATRA